MFDHSRVCCVTRGDWCDGGQSGDALVTTRSDTSLFSDYFSATDDIQISLSTEWGTRHNESELSFSTHLTLLLHQIVLPDATNAFSVTARA